MIDMNDYMEHTCYSFKSLVEPNFSQKSLSPFSNMAQHYKAKFTFKQAKLINVNTDNSIEVEVANGTNETMRFDFLVICTGFGYANPIKDEKSVTLRDRTESLDALYDKIKDARSVLIAGAGIVGIEVCAEIAVAYGKEKKVGICLRGDKLLANLPSRFGESATDFFKKNGIQIHTKTPYTENTLKELDYDYAIQCLGYTFKTDYMKKNFASCLAPNGQIYVNDLF
jgi:NADH dehydrogenase FAD-containing subunit